MAKFTLQKRPKKSICIVNQMEQEMYMLTLNQNAPFGSGVTSQQNGRMTVPHSLGYHTHEKSPHIGVLHSKCFYIETGDV